MRIGVIGCGVAGMTAAIALKRLGHDVEILERFAAPQPLGAGLLLQPTGLAGLDALGLGEAVRARGAQVDSLIGDTPKGRRVLTLRYREDAPGLGIHRASLFDVLFDAVCAEAAPVIAGFEAEDVISSDNGAYVSATDGARRGPYDLTVIADGSASRLRDRVAPNSKAREYPFGAFWAILPDPDGAWTGTLRQVYESCSIMIGVLPVGRAPNAPEALNHVAMFWSVKRAKQAEQRAAGLDALRAEIERRWPDAARLVEHADSMDVWADALYRDVRARPWVNGRSVLIGDAAHGTSPQLGQGANLAIIDALTLAHFAGAADEDRAPDDILAAYRKARKGHVGYFQFMSSALTPVFQSELSFIGWLRDLVLGPLCALPGSRDLMRATLTGRARWGASSWRGPWEQ